MANKRRKILFLAEGITMTHFARPAALAEALDPTEWDVSFWTPKRYHALLPPRFRLLGELRTLDPQTFLQSLASGSVLYTADVLKDYVRQDMEILKEVTPDLVLGDFRLSLCISAPACGIPFASIFNAHWSPYRRQPAIVPELPITRWISPAILGAAFSLIKPFIYAQHAKPVNETRRFFGLSPLSNDIRGIYTAGDLVLYPDIPEFVPLKDAPPHHHFIGPCLWSSPTPKPDWWQAVMSSTRPKIFVSLGSSGPIKALPAVLAAADGMPVDVIVATSGRSVGKMGPNVHIADLLPYAETARSCAIVVSHGGTGGLYPTLAAGAPMLAIPANVDSHLSAVLLQESGAGLRVRVEEASVKTVRQALERLLAERRFKEKAVEWEKAIARHNTTILFPDLLRRWFAARA